MWSGLRRYSKTRTVSGTSQLEDVAMLSSKEERSTQTDKDTLWCEAPKEEDKETKPLRSLEDCIAIMNSEVNCKYCTYIVYRVFIA